jgi:nitrite reductase (NADH) small subunit
MNERCWIWITEVDNVPLREGRVVSVAGRELALFNVGGRIFATDNRCPHKGGPLADGIVTGEAVVCPLHGWRVRLADGRVDRPGGEGACVETYPTYVDNGIIVVGLPAAGTGATEAGDAA